MTKNNRFLLWQINQLLIVRYVVRSHVRTPHESYKQQQQAETKKILQKNYNKTKWIIMYWLLCIREQIHLRSFLLKKHKEKQQKIRLDFFFLFLACPGRVDMSGCVVCIEIFSKFQSPQNQYSATVQHIPNIFFRFNFPVKFLMIFLCNSSSSIEIAHRDKNQKISIIFHQFNNKTNKYEAIHKREKHEIIRCH